MSLHLMHSILFVSNAEEPEGTWKYRGSQAIESRLTDKLRGKNTMLDRDLAERFPEDFMFALALKRGGNIKYLPRPD